MNLTSYMHTIWLIDDSAASNLLNQKMIEDQHPKVKIVAFTMASEAISQLKKVSNPVDMIFLDLNMPGMDGWDFLDEFEIIKSENQLKTHLILLTTSLNPEDEFRAVSNKLVSKYLQKPLKKDQINAVFKKLDSY